MNRGLFAYIYDFLSIVLDKTDNINAIILFGSIARGNFSKKSDIDLFFDIKSGVKEIEKKIFECINEFEIIAEKKWIPRGIDNPIRPIIGNIEDKRWSALKNDLISEGIMLYGKYEELPKNLKHFMLFKYELSKEPKDKVKLIRKLFGYKTIKNKRVYEQKGIVDEIGGRKIGNIVLIPIKEASSFFEILNKNKIKSLIEEIWIKE